MSCYLLMVIMCFGQNNLTHNVFVTLLNARWVSISLATQYNSIHNVIYKWKSIGNWFKL